MLRCSGTPEAPITIRAFPGEQVIVHGGLREFWEAPETSWQEFSDGAPGEFVSTRTYGHLDDRRVPHQFLPTAWEPMWGLEEERPLALGHFADSLVPLHGYRLLVDLRSTNEYWLGNKQEMRDTGIYAGPGLWFNRLTGRIHIRLAHHQLEGLSSNGYRGETDPRKIPLSIAVGFGDDVVRINGIHDVVIQDLVLLGATGSPMIHLYGSQRVALEGLSVYGGFPGLLINASQDIRVMHCAFRGMAAPWTSRAHMKYRGTASYQVILQDNQPTNENIELAWCEFTDDHDFAFLRHAKNLDFHHNLVDNFNDDGLECGPKLREQSIFIHHNRIGRCLIPLTQHEITKDESPLDHDPGKGVYIYRNVFDMRGGTYSSPPAAPDPTGAFLHREGHLIGDHGSPIYPVMFVYQNTFLRDTPVFRNYFLFGLGAQGLRHTERDVFNNIFVQTKGVPGVQFTGIPETAALREGGNLLWGDLHLSDTASRPEPWSKFRASPLFEKSRAQYPPGWTSQDLVADPRLVAVESTDGQPCDLRLTAQSPARGAGRPLPEAWPDPLRPTEGSMPDSGVLPYGAEPWRIGVRERLPLFSP